jgi:hypothetical protein
VFRAVSTSGLRVGYLSGHPKQQHLGLGTDTHAEETVYWPNGDIAQFANLKADTTYTIVQGHGLSLEGAAAKQPGETPTT